MRYLLFPFPPNLLFLYIIPLCFLQINTIYFIREYTKSKAQFPYRHNHRIGDHHSNQNIVSSLTENNIVLLNNLQDNETNLATFKRLYSNNTFHGQLKVNGEEAKQTRFLYKFLVYPPYKNKKNVHISAHI